MAIQSKDVLTLKFEGDVDSISIETFLAAVDAITITAKAVQAEQGSSHKIDFKIRTPERGSFILLMDVEATILQTVLHEIGVGALDAIGAGIVGGILYVFNYYRLKKNWFGLSVGNATPTLRPGHFVRVDEERGVYQFFQGDVLVAEVPLSIQKAAERQDVLEASQRLLALADADEAITGITATGNTGQEPVALTRNEFTEIVDQLHSIDTVRMDVRRSHVLNQIAVQIVRVDFGGPDQAWTFMAAGQKIKAKIVDDAFMLRVENGEAFSKGDSLIVDIDMVQELDEETSMFFNRPKAIHTIYRVHGHERVASQSALAF